MHIIHAQRLGIPAEGTSEITLINQSHIPQHHLQGTEPHISALCGISHSFHLSVQFVPH